MSYGLYRVIRGLVTGQKALNNMFKLAPENVCKATVANSGFMVSGFRFEGLGFAGLGWNMAPARKLWKSRLLLRGSLLNL